MVVERGDVKRRRKDAQDSLEGSPKRTKVHAQRKFAQGAGMSTGTSTSPPVSMTTPVKDKPKMNGVSPSELGGVPSRVGAGAGAGPGPGAANRPHTEDFLTYLCFRGTKALPSRLNVFNTPHNSDHAGEDHQQVSLGGQQDQSGVGTSSSSSSSSSPAATSRQSQPTTTATGSSHQDKYKRNANSKGKLKQNSAVQALKEKYREQRLSRQKVSLAQLARKVKGKNMMRTRSKVLLEERSKKQKPAPEIAKPAPSKVRTSHPVILKRLGVNMLRAGLRSSGKLPPGSDIGIKSDRKPRRTLSSKLQSKSVPPGRVAKKKPPIEALSDIHEPLAKKLRPIASRSRALTRRKAIPPSSLPNIRTRPSRKTKEAAAIYMEMLTKDLRSPDEDFEEDEEVMMSIESFPELPNSSRSEEREPKGSPVQKKQPKTAKLKEKREMENKKTKVQATRGRPPSDNMKGNKKSLESSKEESSSGVETRTTRKSSARVKDSSPPRRVLRTKRNRVSLAEDRFSESEDEDLYYNDEEEEEEDKEHEHKSRMVRKMSRRSLRRSEPRDSQEDIESGTPVRELKNRSAKTEAKKSLKAEKFSDTTDEKEASKSPKKKVTNRKLGNRKTRKWGRKLDEVEQDWEQDAGNDSEVAQDEVKKTRHSRLRRSRINKCKSEELKVNTRRQTRQTSLEKSDFDIEESKTVSPVKRRPGRGQYRRQSKKGKEKQEEHKHDEELEDEDEERVSKNLSKLSAEPKGKNQAKNDPGSSKPERKVSGTPDCLIADDEIKTEPSEIKEEPNTESGEQKKKINNNNDDDHNKEVNSDEHKTNHKCAKVKSVADETIECGGKKLANKEGLSKTKKNCEELMNVESSKKSFQGRNKKSLVDEEKHLLETEEASEPTISEGSGPVNQTGTRKVHLPDENRHKPEAERPVVSDTRVLKTCDILETKEITPLDRITDSLTRLKAGQLTSPLLTTGTNIHTHTNFQCGFGLSSSSSLLLENSQKAAGIYCKMESFDKIKPKEELLSVVIGSGHDEKYNPEQEKKQHCHSALLANFSIKDKAITDAKEDAAAKSEMKPQQSGQSAAKSIKPSIGDTWREAFKNAKIPKPGQLSPIPRSVKPFVRNLPRPFRPFVTPNLTKDASKSESEKGNNGEAPAPRPSNNFGAAAFPGRRFFPAKDGNASDKRSEEHESEKKPVKSLTQLQYEKRTSELVSGLKDTAVITDDQFLTSANWGSTDDGPSKREDHEGKVEAKNKPAADAGKPLGEGKHLNLPFPVEHTLRKHSPTTVTRKPPTAARYQLAQESKPPPAAHNEEPQKKDRANETSPVPVPEPQVQAEPPPVVKPAAIASDLTVKKKVNMTTEEIKGWLSDNTSTGIKHHKDCQIFKNNHCVCSYRTRSSSMEASGGVSQLVPPLPAPSQPSAVVEVGKSVVEPPVRLKELGADPKYCTETISTCKVEEYKEIIMSKNAQKNEPKSTKSSPELSKDLPPPPPKTKRVCSNNQLGSKRSRSATDDETSGEMDLRFDRNTCSPARESGGSELSSPTPRDDVSSSNDETPEKANSHPEHRKTIFHQKRSLNNKRPPLSKSPCAFSAENESSVYAFEPDLPFNKPFRRSTGSGASAGSRNPKPQDNHTATSSSIAVQVNLETEAVLECSTQTEREVDDEGHLFYIPLQQSPGDSTGVPPQQLIQGVAVKLDTEGPDQRVIMRAKLVTKPPTTFASSSRSLVSTVPSGGRTQAPKPEQKVRPLGSSVQVATCTSSLVTPIVTAKPPPVVGTVQPTVRRITTADQSTGTVAAYEEPVRPQQNTQATQATPVQEAAKMTPVTPVKEEPQPQQQQQQPQPHQQQQPQVPSYPPKQGKRQSSDGGGSRTKVPTTLTPIGSSDFPKRGSQPCLVEAPTFRPSEKEFQDPLEYIEKITPLAQQFGICRIIPPSNFKPECKVSDDMRFTAYNQYIQKMLYRWGPNVKEMSAIRKYLKTQSIALTQPPWIGSMEVDLPRLYQTVQQCGGLKEVIEKKRWTRVADAMKIPKSAQDRVTKLDDIYCKFLLPYDTLSHDERNKLLKEVEEEWRERERREAIEDSNDASSDNESSDTFDRDECITKGRNMALSAFYRIARNTMAMWFKDNPPSAGEVETEFWRHVSTGQSHICVHSASIDCGTWGYGFPTSRSSSTSRHPWNLKVLTNNPGSVLKSIGPLMGVTVPTLHVGMLFTACCWYRDPHALPWIEYLHTGASKVWYGVPDDWSSELKTALKGLLPHRLVRDKPVWLPSDTAMVPPALLVDRGVPLCRTVQEPRQFVLVFPKAFTSSICTGYLVSESVYFAQPSWLDTAETVFKDVQDSSEPTIFSLEKLLFCIATDSKSSVDVLNQVLPMVMRVRDNEVRMRREVESVGVVVTERLPNKATRGGASGTGSRHNKHHHQDASQDFECDTCRATLFLSHVTNSHEEVSYCLTHAVDMLKKDSSQLKYCKLLYNYDEEEIEELIEKVKNKIESKSQKKSHGKGNAGNNSKN